MPRSSCPQLLREGQHYCFNQGGEYPIISFEFVTCISFESVNHINVHLPHTHVHLTSTQGLAPEHTDQQTEFNKPFKLQGRECKKHTLKLTNRFECHVCLVTETNSWRHVYRTFHMHTCLRICTRTNPKTFPHGCFSLDGVACHLRNVPSMSRHVQTRMRMHSFFTLLMSMTSASSLPCLRQKEVLTVYRDMYSKQTVTYNSPKSQPYRYVLYIYIYIYIYKTAQ